ncbi:unnamed protein product, partial [Ectocarpus fasciculatus]
MSRHSSGGIQKIPTRTTWSRAQPMTQRPRLGVSSCQAVTAIREPKGPGRRGALTGGRATQQQQQSAREGGRCPMPPPLLLLLLLLVLLAVSPERCSGFTTGLSAVATRSCWTPSRRGVSTPSPQQHGRELHRCTGCGVDRSHSVSGRSRRLRLQAVAAESDNPNTDRRRATQQQGQQRVLQQQQEPPTHQQQQQQRRIPRQPPQGVSPSPGGRRNVGAAVVAPRTQSTG